MSDQKPSPEALAASARKFAQSAGEILIDLFGKRVEVDYKNKEKTDPVSEADRASQDFLTKSISTRYPQHAVLGEEKNPDEKEAEREGKQKIPEFLWVLDPLDGTKNFLNGLSVWGCSVGVLHQGRPVAGAIFTPEPSSEGAGTVYWAWNGGGAFRDDHPIQVAEEDRPTGRRIASLPGSYWTQFRPTGGLRSSLGEVRAPGSIAYELALVARGGLHYALFGGPSIWDIAAGIILVQEAGGSPLVRRNGTDRWDLFETFFPAENYPADLDRVRKWHQSLLVGNPALCSFISANIRKINRPKLWFRKASSHR
jgi:myo-inositol-1(or 4)-monophosphatase